jgi:OOP family OmpA-OmpF porin
MLAAVGLVGCSGEIAFQDKAAVAILGDLPPPPPPPPPPKKEEPPPPPPRVEVRDNKIEITEKVQFDHAKATIKPESHSLLDEIVDVVKKNPHIKKIAIEGHASADGNAAFNRRLSDGRAKAVMQYLVEHGIDAAALTAKGFGPDKPLTTNDTEEGREKNRRVEFNIVEQDVTMKKVAIDPKTGKEKVLETTSVPTKVEP